ncbi:phosphatase PAP2 family protein [Flavobacterium xinjiangense]|uniref:PAP2 superfamily protein n=1 Tax=Flavobacterium xinjiangense TaxID=178356 RepID=A0A1M7PIU0_9FLAO|nr:phosphatase PAP2 family protein [Flavobacterium xinjiangense]SHN17055.1 PAP2 superfamily protein [Flavobacterium xinjiangense]
MKKRSKLLKSVFFTLFIFCVSIVNAQNIDIDILRDINVNRNKNLDFTYKVLSNSTMEVSTAIPIIMYTVGFIKKDSAVRKHAIFIGETFLVNGFITAALKVAVRRERPYNRYSDIDRATSAIGYSFPSGHTSTAFSTATSLSMVYPKWYVIAPSFVWASAVGYSRLHLGVHYPSDVIAGAVLGSGSAYLTYKANKWLNKKRSKREK